jgi:hypothetical protein
MNLTYHVVTFGLGTQLVVSVGETPTKLKCYRFNASRCGMDMKTSRYVRGEDGMVTHDDDGFIKYETVDRKPSMVPKGKVQNLVSRNFFIEQCITRGLNSETASYNGYTGAYLRDHIESVLAELAAR